MATVAHFTCKSQPDPNVPTNAGPESHAGRIRSIITWNRFRGGGWRRITKKNIWTIQHKLHFVLTQDIQNLLILSEQELNFVQQTV